MIRDQTNTDNSAEEIRVLKAISHVSARLAKNLSDLAKKQTLKGGKEYAGYETDHRSSAPRRNSRRKTDMANPTKVITGVNTRWSYANVWEPKSINDSKPKYSVSLIIPKNDTATIEKCRAAIKAAYDAGQSKLKGNNRTVPALESLKTPLRDGEPLGGRTSAEEDFAEEEVFLG